MKAKAQERTDTLKPTFRKCAVMAFPSEKLDVKMTNLRTTPNSTYCKLYIFKQMYQRITQKPKFHLHHETCYQFPIMFPEHKLYPYPQVEAPLRFLAPPVPREHTTNISPLSLNCLRFFWPRSKPFP